ncbi:MAG: hypothetical protein ACJ8F7_14530 [Gemmataceae bacterium]
MIDEPDDLPGRPPAVGWLWAYCGAAILLALACLAGGAVLVAMAGDIGGDDEPETYMVIGAILAFGALAVGLTHAIPFFLKRRPESWKLVNGLLIGWLIFWALTFTLFIVGPVVLLTFWSRPNVREYYGVEVPGRRRRRDLDDDGWEDDWERPRRHPYSD